MSGDHGFPTWRGPIRTWSNFGQYNDFAGGWRILLATALHDWRLRAARGARLSLMTRYFSGHGAKPKGADGSREWNATATCATCCRAVR